MNVQMAGGLLVQLAADVSGLRKDMDDAKKVVGDSALEVEKAVGLMKSAFVALAGVGSFAAFAGMIKGAIDASAALHDLSITTGVSVSALGQFKSVGAFTETSIESISGAMTKLAKNMSLADEEGKGAALAIKTLGIDFDSFKKMSPDEQMLAVAQSMNGFKDGADKSAAAMLLFGKSGATLLPFLKDLGDSAEEIKAKLTDQEKALRDSQAAMADAFGDNLTALRKNSEGWKKDLAAGLLPALYEFSQTMLKMTGGAGGLRDTISALAKDGTLAEWARGAMTAFSYLVDIVQAFFSLIPMLGKVIAGVAAGGVELFTNMGDAIDKVLKGDFSGAVDSMKNGFDAVKTIGSATAADVSAIWNQKLIGQTFRETMDSLKGVQVEAKQAGKDLNLSEVLRQNEEAKKAEAAAIKAAEEAQRKQIAAYEAAVKAGEELMAAIGKKNDELQREVDLGRKLTAAEKELIDFEAKLKSGKMILTKEEEASTRARIANNRELEKELQWLEETTAANGKAREALEKETRSIEDQVDKQKEANEAIGMSREELELLEISTLNAKAADKDRVAVLMEDVDWSGQTTAEYHKQADKLRELADLKKEGIHLKAAQESAEEWKKTTESINSGLTDSLMRAFESGKGFAQAFRDTLVKSFESLVLKPAVEFIMRPIAGLIAGGFSTMAGAVTGTGAGANGMSLLEGSTYYNALKGLGSSATGAYTNFATSQLGSSLGLSTSAADVGEAGFGSTLTPAGEALGTYGGAALGAIAGHYLGRAISGGYSTGGSGNTNVNLGAAIGALWGPIGSIVGGAIGGLVNRAFGRKAPEMQGYGVQGDFAGGGFVGQQYKDWTQQGGWFKSDRAWTDLDPVSAELQQSLQVGAAGVLAQAKTYASALGLPVDALDKMSTSVRIAFGDNEADNLKAIAAAFEQYGQQLSGQYADAVKDAARAGESTTETLQRLGGSLLSVNGVFETLGLHLANVSVAGGQAASDLLDLTGGLDKFLAKTQAYIGSYFSEGEQSGLAARAILEQLSGAGLDFSGAKGRQDLRTLLESLDVNNAEQRQQIAALLNVASDYAKVADYMKTAGLTLGEVAALAPKSSVLDSGGQKTIDPVTDRSIALQEQGNGLLDGISKRLDAVQSSIEAGLTAVASASSDTYKLLRRWDTPDGMAVAMTP